MATEADKATAMQEYEAALNRLQAMGISIAGPPMASARDAVPTDSIDYAKDNAVQSGEILSLSFQQPNLLHIPG